MKKLWNWFKSLFTRENVGIIWQTLLTATKSRIAAMISDAEVQAKAFALAKSLMGGDLTSEEKRTAFNAQMREWLASVGKDVGESTLATLRELAVSSCKAEAEETAGATDTPQAN